MRIDTTILQGEHYILIDTTKQKNSANMLFLQHKNACKTRVTRMVVCPHEFCIIFLICIFMKFHEYEQSAVAQNCHEFSVTLKYIVYICIYIIYIVANIAPLCMVILLLKKSLSNLLYNSHMHRRIVPKNNITWPPLLALSTMLCNCYVIRRNRLSYMCKSIHVYIYMCIFYDQLSSSFQ